jgi:FkbM family methyltransferase
VITFKKLLKAIIPYGFVYIYAKQKKNNDGYSFQIDPKCLITGWIEPAHVKIELDIKDWIQKQIFYNGMYEKETVKKLYELLPQNGVFFDIGANIGVYSLNLFHKAKDVFAFEATKTTYDKLNKTIEENNINNIHLNFYAVDDKDEKEVSIFRGDAALGSLNNGSNSMFTGGVVANTVQTIRLDTFVENTNISKIDRGSCKTSVFNCQHTREVFWKPLGGQNTGLLQNAN